MYMNSVPLNYSTPNWGCAPYGWPTASIIPMAPAPAVVLVPVPMPISASVPWQGAPGGNFGPRGPQGRHDGPEPRGPMGGPGNPDRPVPPLAPCGRDHACYYARKFIEAEQMGRQGA